MHVAVPHNHEETAWNVQEYQEPVRFNFTVVHNKGRENSNPVALRRSIHIVDPPPLEDDEYAEFYEVDKQVISFEDSMNTVS